MPRSTQSRGVRRGRKATEAEPIVDEVQDPQVEQALNNATPEITFDERMTDEERTEFSAMLNPDATEDELRERGQTDVDGERLVPAAETQALHARDFNWDTMRWVPPKTNGTRPCLCNRLRGSECDLSTKSRFAIGHDARFKGILQTAFRSGAKLPWTFETGDTLTTDEGTSTKLDEPVEQMLAADQIARMVAPKLLPHVTHESRGARLQALDAAAGTTVPQTAVDHPKADEDITDADLADVVDDAEGVDAQFVES
jgi:hypothetical protein